MANCLHHISLSTTYLVVMCILFLHYHPSGSSGGGQCKCPYTLVAANNRDEFFERTTNPLAYWGEGKSILGGQDVHRVEESERGTWLGVSNKGRFAVLTNYRCRVDQLNPEAKTRGLIVSNFLSGATPPQQYCESLLAEGGLYNGFSAIVAELSSAEGSEVVYCSNRVGCVASVLSPGDYALSNAELDCSWRKVQHGKQQFQQVMSTVGQGGDTDQLTEALMTVLTDDTNLHPDPNIPDTGFSEEALQSTSSVFVRPITLYGHLYGTRTSSVVLWDRSGKVTFTERNLNWPPSPVSPDWTTKQYSHQTHVPSHHL